MLDFNLLGYSSNALQKNLLEGQLAVVFGTSLV